MSRNQIVQCQWSKVCIQGREEACRRCLNTGYKNTLWRKEHNEYRCHMHKDLVSKCCLPMGLALDEIIQDLTNIDPNDPNIISLTTLLESGVRCRNDAEAEHFLCNTHKRALAPIMNRDYFNYKATCDNDSVNQTYQLRNGNWQQYINHNHCLGVKDVDTVDELTQNIVHCNSYIKDIDQCYAERKSYNNKYITRPKQNCIQACCQRHDHFEKTLNKFKRHAITKKNYMNNKLTTIRQKQEEEARIQEEEARIQEVLMNRNEDDCPPLGN